MEQIINEIWADAEKFGWEAIKKQKDYYLNLAMKFENQDEKYEIIESKMNKN